jgi:putative redox protein
MSLRAVARRVGDTVRHEIEVDGHTVVSDEPERWGGTGTGPSPQELLAAAFASCTATQIEMYARYREWDIGPVEVEVEYESHSNPKRFRLSVRLADDLPDERVKRLKAAARACAVRQTLTGEVELEESVERGLPADAREDR